MTGFALFKTTFSGNEEEIRIRISSIVAYEDYQVHVVGGRTFLVVHGATEIAARISAGEARAEIGC